MICKWKVSAIIIIISLGAIVLMYMNGKYMIHWYKLGKLPWASLFAFLSVQVRFFNYYCLLVWWYCSKCIQSVCIKVTVRKVSKSTRSMETKPKISKIGMCRICKRSGLFCGFNIYCKLKKLNLLTFLEDVLQRLKFSNLRFWVRYREAVKL